MRSCREPTIAACLLVLGLIAGSCSHTSNTQSQAVLAPVEPHSMVAQPRRPLTSVPRAQGAVIDQSNVLTAQRALLQLGYHLGEADGVMGPATKRAIQAFQKDRGLTENGQLTVALISLLDTLVAQLPKSTSITVETGDTIILNDGTTESVARERVVQWTHEGIRRIVAVRPSTDGWPPAARAGLDWAITHALDDGDSRPIQWSSSGVAQQFEIQVVGLANDDDLVSETLCLRFELREVDPARRFPGIACRDPRGDWLLAHTHIRLARPATSLGVVSGSPPP